MPETTRRVNVVLTFASEIETDRVMLGVAGHLPDELSAVLESTSVYSFDLGDAPEPCALLVLREDGSVTAAFIDDPGSAHALAERVRGVVAELPISADYRGEVTA